MNCPVCKESLGVIEHEGQILHRCISCSGLLLDTDVFQEIQKESDRHLSFLLTKPEKTMNKKARGARKCPECGKKMKCVDYEWDTSIEIDVCDACKKIWLDGGELAQIHEHLKNNHPELVESDLEHESRKFFLWVKYMLTRIGENTPGIG